MIKIFRSIRQSLIMEQNNARYLKYALGEIVLVVVGILIALQINNWNEDQKFHKLEIKKLREISNSLIQTKANIQQAQEEDSRWMHYNEIILEHLEYRKPYTPELDVSFGSYFWFSRPEIEFSAFEQLKSTGLDLVSNDQLRTEIVRLFEKRFQLIYSENNQWNLEYINVTLPIHLKLFRKVFPETWVPGNDEYAKPIDYDGLLDNDEFKNLLAENIALRKFGISYYDIAIEECNNLINSISTEINRLEDE
ncbi:DUF6090 family protein [Aegicerativicinus sediminis]|uniref:DUF6090 family protein n=1 Tax=Aegicerativicinus sediminis TaxID=2893202 RepID=UPI001E4C8214|nr:DUF6090 family protein [Aegicerativicinus sediminis]